MTVLSSPDLTENLTTSLRWAGHANPEAFVTYLPPGSLPEHHFGARGMDRAYCALIATLARHFPGLHPSDLGRHATRALSTLAHTLIHPASRETLTIRLAALADPHVHLTPGTAGHALSAALHTAVPTGVLFTAPQRFDSYESLNAQPVLPHDLAGAVRAALDCGVALRGEAAALITSGGLATGLIDLTFPQVQSVATTYGSVAPSHTTLPAHLTLTGLAGTTLPYAEADRLRMHLIRLLPSLPVQVTLSDGHGDHQALRRARSAARHDQPRGVDVRAFWADALHALQSLPFTDEVWAAFALEVEQDFDRDPADDPNPFIFPQETYFGL
ncbi:hypothetical protein [Deinococcus ficus]|uniref:Uncharacterized protein n=1 Tax=Deinococcus ficus TaxID=317577 RepID=A0A221T3B9_9DEIO|nr:hypothetical protein [Deinococcus ficus]ASN83350.1 hypothetical protein DFI_19320 [Deinococcus ficus]